MHQGKVDGLSAIVQDTLLTTNQKNLKFAFPVDASDGADVVIVGPEVQNVADLKGRCIGAGFGTYGELYVRTFLQQNGLPLTDISLVNCPAESIVASYQSDVDSQTLVSDAHGYDTDTRKAPELTRWHIPRIRRGDLGLLTHKNLLLPILTNYLQLTLMLISLSSWKIGT